MEGSTASSQLRVIASLGNSSEIERKENVCCWNLLPEDWKRLSEDSSMCVCNSVTIECSHKLYQRIIQSIVMPYT
jgi:hypothetical protein